MKLRIGLLLLFTALPAFGTSSTCPIANLSTYDAPGFSCREGPLHFSHFTFSSVTSGNGGQVGAFGVGVTPLSGQGGFPSGFADSYGFIFTSDNFFAGDTDCPYIDPTQPISPECLAGSQHTLIGYTVTGPFSQLSLWLGPDVFLRGIDVEAANTWDLFLPGLGIAVGTNAGGSNPAPDSLVCQPLCTSADVMNVLDLSASIGETTALCCGNGVFNGYLGPPPSVPEPSSLPILGSGLFALAGSVSLTRGRGLSRPR
jgi:hypothetical protein